MIEALALLGAEELPKAPVLTDEPASGEPASSEPLLNVMESDSSEPKEPPLAEELASLIELDEAMSSTQEPPDRRTQVSRSASVLLSSGAQHLSLRGSAWEVLWVTLKLAKVFPRERCQALSRDGGSLSVLEMQQIKVHIEQVLLKNMERGDYLFADLSLSDLAPAEAFKEGDPRREEHLDRASLHQLTSFAHEARATVMVRRLQWRQDHARLSTGDPAAAQRAKRRGGEL